MSKNIKLSALISLFIAGVFTSCYKDVTVPVVAPPVTKDVSFSADVLPIFSSECASCHRTGGTPPDLSPTNAYSALSGSSFVNTSNPSGSELYERMAGIGSKPVMPPSGANSANAAMILAWIQQGAKNN